MVGERHDEFFQIFKAFAQRRDGHGDDRDAVIKVLAEGPLTHGAGQVTVGGGDEPEGGMDLLGPAHAHEAVLLQYAQELDLHVHGDIAHFVDEQRAVVRQFKKADLLSRGACEGAFFMPEELVFEEMLGNRGRVYGDERPFAAAVPVHVVGHDLLAHARFPEQEHGGVRGGDDFGAFKAHAE